MSEGVDTHKSQIGFADLLKAALRHRPDRIIVGEIRGPEARVFSMLLTPAIVGRSPQSTPTALKMLYDDSHSLPCAVPAVSRWSMS